MTSFKKDWLRKLEEENIKVGYNDGLKLKDLNVDGKHLVRSS